MQGIKKLSYSASFLQKSSTKAVPRPFSFRSSHEVNYLTNVLPFQVFNFSNLVSEKGEFVVFEEKLMSTNVSNQVQAQF